METNKNQSLLEAQNWMNSVETTRSTTPEAVFHEVNSTPYILICPTIGNRQFLVVPQVSSPISVYAPPTIDPLTLLADAAATQQPETLQEYDRAEKAREYKWIPSYKQNTRLCTVCGTSQTVNRNGTLRAHRNPLNRRLQCAGS
tara:strand:- start:575 stop:1006 length:432 start_codon:yes stop_codon:yes gene_type:complete